MLNPFAWIRDALGIRKDSIEAKKAKLEIERLEREDSPIQRATMEDIYEICPSCAGAIDGALQEQPGLRACSVCEGTGRIRIRGSH